jgi:hypothetical protein
MEEKKGEQMMDLTAYRASEKEQHRTQDLLALLPESGSIALDIGARDGHFSRLLALRFESVVALDLSSPDILHERVSCVAGDVTALQFADNTFDAVLCAEVLEHIPPNLLSRACAEIARVTKGVAVIGVPYKQDLRVGRTTCQTCGRFNPPYGHVNAFDEARLAQLFGNAMDVEKVSFVGESLARTNALSTWLLDRAGNPFGTYDQDESCIHCGGKLLPPKPRTFLQKVLTRAAFVLNRGAGIFARSAPQWIHQRLAKR